MVVSVPSRTAEPLARREYVRRKVRLSAPKPLPIISVDVSHQVGGGASGGGGRSPARAPLTALLRSQEAQAELDALNEDALWKHHFRADRYVAPQLSPEARARLESRSRVRTSGAALRETHERHHRSHRARTEEQRLAVIGASSASLTRGLAAAQSSTAFALPPTPASDRQDSIYSPLTSDEGLAPPSSYAHAMPSEVPAHAADKRTRHGAGKASRAAKFAAPLHADEVYYPSYSYYVYSMSGSDDGLRG